MIQQQVLNILGGGTDNKLNTHPFDKMDNGVKSNGAFVSGIWLALSGTTGVRSE